MWHCHCSLFAKSFSLILGHFEEKWRKDRKEKIPLKVAKSILQSSCRDLRRDLRHRVIINRWRRKMNGDSPEWMIICKRNERKKNVSVAEACERKCLITGLCNLLDANDRRDYENALVSLSLSFRGNPFLNWHNRRIKRLLLLSSVRKQCEETNHLFLLCSHRNGAEKGVRSVRSWRRAALLSPTLDESFREKKHAE